MEKLGFEDAIAFSMHMSEFKHTNITQDKSSYRQRKQTS